MDGAGPSSPGQADPASAEDHSVERDPGRFRAIVDQAGEAVLLINPAGVVTYANTAASRMFEATSGDLIGQPLNSLLVVDDPGTCRDNWCLDGRGQGFRQNRVAFPIEVSTIVRSGEGAVEVCLFVRDRTAEVTAAEALKQSEANFRAVIEGSPDCLAVCRDGRILYANPRLVETLDYRDAAEVIGRTLPFLVHPDERRSLDRFVSDDGTEARARASREFRLRRSDGGAMVAEMHCFQVTYDGHPATVLSARDVSARRQLTARMMQFDRMIAVGTLAAGVGHEINNPLAYVSSNLEFVGHELADLEEALRSGLIHLSGGGKAQSYLRRVTEIRVALDEAREGADRVRDVVNDLRTFARGADEKRGPVVLSQLMDSVLQLARPEIRHRARLARRYDPGVPPVEADAARLGQVFLNLVLNAAQSIPEGASEAHLITVGVRTDESLALVEITDSGGGIPAEIRRRIFDPFFTTKPVGQGTGLGLSMCRQIVHSLGGEIRFETEVGQGTTFTVELPISLVREPTPLPSAPMAGSEPRARLMVIDDEPRIGSSLRRLLRRNFDVETYTRAGSALEAIAQGFNPAVILCDLMMPEMTGYDFYDALEQQAPELCGQVIFFTGGAFTPAARAFLKRVDNPTLDKPVDPLVLRTAIRKMMDG